MASIEFGFATVSDLDDLLALYAVLRPQYPAYARGEAEKALASLLGQPHLRLIVARLDERVVATCRLALLANIGRASRPIGLLEYVVTAGQFQRKGIGQQMLAFALDVAWHLDCCKVVLLSGTQRDLTHMLYEELGFRGDREHGFIIDAPF
ncbi:hypothetical protein BTH42_29845 [Burkholderia sp. SRS-W-2-2016]|uniref:GNAT family N-acetyltransferase n=1 Tax=Burkholderia sp. SRS-W-2-2016 TaxID=1926878 RepID=UPI00094B3758|nr:GNAT family N-acetyltransferase [Burkholderia sp. SRS-W-2-2016]OLL27994.1 hypothetical protein BTH42_29845 [Burkholderia sp. SRS-W-2-2016]